MRYKIRSYLKISVILATFLTILTYACYEASAIIKGPSIVIEYPQNGLSVHNEMLAIQGHANNISFLYLNGRPVYTNSAGKFIEKIILSSGLNSLFIQAEDRVGKKIEKILEIILINNTASTTNQN